MQVVKGGCCREDEKTALYPFFITNTSGIIFVVLMTIMLAICMFLYDMTTYMPMLKQPKPKVSIKSVMKNMHTYNIAAHVTLYSHGHNKKSLIQ